MEVGAGAEPAMGAIRPSALGERLPVLVEELPHPLQSAVPIRLLEAVPDAGVQAVENEPELVPCRAEQG